MKHVRRQSTSVDSRRSDPLESANDGTGQINKNKANHSEAVEEYGKKLITINIVSAEGYCAGSRLLKVGQAS